MSFISLFGGYFEFMDKVGCAFRILGFPSIAPMMFLTLRVALKLYIFYSTQVVHSIE